MGWVWGHQEVPGEAGHHHPGQSLQGRRGGGQDDGQWDSKINKHTLDTRQYSVKCRQ